MGLLSCCKICFGTTMEAGWVPYKSVGSGQILSEWRLARLFVFGIGLLMGAQIRESLRHQNSGLCAWSDVGAIARFSCKKLASSVPSPRESAAILSPNPY